MKTINLREYYPDFYKEDTMTEVSEDVLEIIKESKRADAAYERRRYRYKAYFSLNCNDGIENEICVITPSSEEIYIKEQYIEEIHRAIATLPEKQARRIYARFFLGMSVTEIAAKEGVAKSRISESIQKALKQLKKIL